MKKSLLINFDMSSKIVSKIYYWQYREQIYYSNLLLTLLDSTTNSLKDIKNKDFIGEVQIKP